MAPIERISITSASALPSTSYSISLSFSFHNEDIHSLCGSSLLRDNAHTSYALEVVFYRLDSFLLLHGLGEMPFVMHSWCIELRIAYQHRGSAFLTAHQ